MASSQKRKRYQWQSFRQCSSGIPAAKAKAKWMNSLIKASELKDALLVGEINPRTLGRWLSQGEFAERLTEIAPSITAGALSRLIAIAQGNLKDVTDVQYKANLDLLKTLAKLAKANVEFDSSVRRQELANKGVEVAIRSYAEIKADVLSKDPFAEPVEVPHKRLESND